MRICSLATFRILMMKATSNSLKICKTRLSAPSSFSPLHARSILPIGFCRLREMHALSSIAIRHLQVAHVLHTCARTSKMCLSLSLAAHSLTNTKQIEQLITISCQIDCSFSIAFFFWEKKSLLDGFHVRKGVDSHYLAIFSLQQVTHGSVS